MSAAGARAHRSWGQRALITFNLLLILSCLVAAAGLGYLWSKVKDIGRIDLGVALTPAGEDGSSGPQNFLIVGTDSGAGLEAGDPVLTGRPGGIRSDTIMILRVDPEAARAALLSMPRDLYVPIAGTSGSDRINAAIQGGPGRLVRTIQEDFGIPINHYIEIDFLAFRKLVDAVDGVPIYFPEPARDRKSGLDVQQAGCTVLDPVQALAFARSRAYEVQRDGRWRADPSGDLGRIERQQLFIERVIERAIDKGARNPIVLDRLISAATAAVHLDPELTPGDLLDLGRRFRDFDPSNLVTYSLPAVPARVRGAAVLKIDPLAAEPILEVFRSVEGGLSPEATVVVQVLNGSGRADQATAAAAGLRAAGFAVPQSTVGDADRFDYAVTKIVFAPDHDADAELVASHLVAGGEIAPTTVPFSADVLVITGADFAGVVAEPAAQPPGAPTTTSPPTTVPTTVDAGSAAASTTTSTTMGVVPLTPEDVDC